MSAREPQAGSVSIPEHGWKQKTFSGDAFRWVTAKQFALDPTEILQAPAEIVKASGAAKSVTRHATPSGTFYVKRYRHDAVALRPLKFLFKPSQARQEWMAAEKLNERCIPIVRHVAFGERWSSRGLLESILITEGFDGVALTDSADFERGAVVQFVKKMAAAGIRHRDFHPANLLVNEATGELRLVDLYGISIAKPGREVETLEKELLAQLCITTALPVSVKVLEHGMALRKAALFARSRRCLHANRDFTIRRFGKLKWHVRRNGLTSEVENVLRGPDEFISAGRVLKRGRSTTVAAESALVMKRYNLSRWLRPLKDLFRSSRALNAFRKAYHLELCGIATARVIAGATERKLGFPCRGFVLMEEIQGVDLRAQVGDVLVQARILGAFIAKVHTEGFAHRDLKETNILFDRGGIPYLIDLEGLTFETDIAEPMAAANLQRMAEGARSCGKLTQRTVVAFLLSYCRNRRLRPYQLFGR